MIVRSLIVMLVLGGLTIAYAEPVPSPAAEQAAEPPADTEKPKPKPQHFEIKDLLIDGSIDGENITFALKFDAEIERNNVEMPLIQGDVVLDQLTSPTDGYALRYETETKTYFIKFTQKGTYSVAGSFAVKAAKTDGGAWRISTFDVPASQVRRLSVTCDRQDLEVNFPHAMRVERNVANEQLTISAILGPGKPFAVKWKPQVQQLDAKLVASIDANILATISAAAVRVDHLMQVDIAQGKLEALKFKVPAGLSITQVRGPFIRDWTLTGKDNDRVLTVTLNRPQSSRYALQVLTEAPLAKMPVELEMPVIQPLDMRARGHVMIGTNSAIALVVGKTSGLNQVDNAAFPRITLDREHARALPSSKAFTYTFAGMPVEMNLSLDDIVPSYDAAHQTVIDIREDDLIVQTRVEIEVRDAPIRSLAIDVPAAFNVAAVEGPLVGDYRLLPTAPNAKTKRLDVEFNQPVLGSTLVALRLELGHEPLDEQQLVSPISIDGAKTQRGYVVVVSDPSVRLDEVAPSDDQAIKPVHTASVPMRVPNAELAYRFRETDWHLNITASRKAAGVRVELFHLTSIGEGMAYGSVAASYFITGSPVDELKFVVPSELSNVEFVGRDVTRWTRDGDVFTVKLRRKVMGDYNLAVTYTQRYADGESILVGGVRCTDVEVQSGYVIVASHLNLNVATQTNQNDALMAIDRDEVPANYRLLANAPILESYKYVEVPHGLSLKLDLYERGELLPVVVEMMEIRSELDVREDGQTESITRVRYRVKNTSSQFLAVQLPPDARFRRVGIVRFDPGGNELPPQWVAASRDESTGALMVPLERNTNPNEPTTLELEYAQEHDPLGFAGDLSMTAPQCAQPATFAEWTVIAPPEWAVRSAGGNTMVVKQTTIERLDFAWIAQRIVQSWSDGVQRLADRTQGVFAGVIALAVLILVLVLRRRYFVDALVLVVLGAIVWAGVEAVQTAPAEAAMAEQPHTDTVQYTQAVNIDPAQPLAVDVSVVPTWREHVTMVGSIFVPIVALACLILSLLLRRIRPVLLAAVLIGAAYAAAQFNEAAPALVHLFTWGLPAIALLVFIVRGLIWPLVTAGHAPTVATAALLLVAACFTPGCVEGMTSEQISEIVTVHYIHAGLAAGEDSMTVDLDAKVTTKRALTVPLLEETAVLLSDAKPVEHVKVIREDGKYQLKFERAGTYELSLQYLSPLAEANVHQVRSFTMPLPTALTNRVTLTVPGIVDIGSNDAVRLTHGEAGNATTATAIFAPGAAASFHWKPRDRQRENEATVFYTQLTSALRFDTGSVEGRHQAVFQIAQGELREIRIAVPDNMTVTAVTGANIGAWRFDPTTHLLEARLSEPATGEYRLHLVTQTTLDRLPHDMTVGSLTVQDTARQRGTMGLMTSPTVFIDITDAPQSMNVDDFARDAATMVNAMNHAGPTPVKAAYRIYERAAAVKLSVMEVKPELRSAEESTFSVADDRLTYNGQFAIDISKAGRFSAELRLPATFDIDALGGGEVSHWDEQVIEGERHVQVHFRRKMLGRVVLNIAMSQPVSELPGQIAVPRINLVDSIKHTGRIIVSSDRGVRLSVIERDGVSELRAADLGINDPGILAYKLLRPDWQLTLGTEVVQPLINLEFLHYAHVTEGRVRHSHLMSYSLRNAGVKSFEFVVPDDALGLQISGPRIARREQVSPGHWRVELAAKWFDRPYPLTLRYETQFDRDAGDVTIAPVVALDVDQQRGYVVVDKADRVALSATKIGSMLQTTDARAIRGFVGAPDLSSAAFAYRTTSPKFELAFNAKRLDAAQQLEANVLSTELTTVITERGEAITRVQLRMRVGGKRYLETQLPEGARVWSLQINGKATPPSIRTNAAGQDVLLLPLAQASLGELPVHVDLMYVQAKPLGRWSGKRELAGPRFDLPLKDVRWVLFVPPQYDYDDLEGTLTPNEDLLDDPVLQDYTVAAYIQNVTEASRVEQYRAKKLQQLGKQLAEQGRQYEARQALELGWNYSQSDAGLNEDIRVDLNNLRRQQAKVGLVGNRGRLRVQGGDANAPDSVDGLGDQYAQADVDRIESQLSKDDADNLEIITARMIEVQEAAAGQSTQLMIDMPLQGRVLEFNRPLQVNPNAEMTVRFTADAKWPETVTQRGAWAGGAFGITAVLFVIIALLAAHWRQMREALAAGKPVEESEPVDDIDEPAPPVEH